MKGMTQGERKATMALSGIFALRMLGLFMIIPVFAIYGKVLTGATPALIGLAIGIYGLTQAVLQIPVGLLADRINRKTLIIAGLLLFAVGGVVAALSSTIQGVILGRAIQGSGAISAVVMALGPFVAAHFGLSGLFWATSILAILGLVLLNTVPQPLIILKQHSDSYWQQFRQCLVHPELLRLNIGILVLHLVMTASFVLLPHLLIDYAYLPASQHGWVYLPIVLGGFIAAVPAIIIAEKKQKIKSVFVFGIGLLMASLMVLAQGYSHYISLLAGITLFFIAFNLLEALLPSLLSKIAPAGSKATAMGIYSSSQFFGAFLGGVCGGILWGNHNIQMAYWLLVVCVLLWLIVASFMRSPRFLHSLMLTILPCNNTQAAALLTQLNTIQGVEEAVVLAQEGCVYLKVDKGTLNEAALQDVMLFAKAT